MYDCKTTMNIDCIPTRLRKRGKLTVAMKKRPTSGDVTVILTPEDDDGVITQRNDAIVI